MSAIPDATLPWPTPRLPAEAVTDVLGNYHLDGVTPGWSTLVLFAPVAFPFLSEGQYIHRPVEVEGGMGLPFDIQLQALVPVSVKPHLRHIRGGALNPQVSTVSLNMRWSSTELELQESGDWTGRVEAGVQVMELLAWSGGNAVSLERTVDLKAGSPVVIPVNHVTSVKAKKEGVEGWVSLKGPVFEFAGHVFLPDGTPALGARVAVRGPVPPRRCGNGPFWYRYVRFEGSGFAVKLFTDQTFAYAWTDNGYAGSVSFSGKEGERVVADIHLKAAGAVKGRLAFLPSPELMEVPPINFNDEDGQELVHIGQDGHFVVAGMNPGSHEMSMHERSETYRFDVQEGVATDVGDVWPAP
ncbi:hypothetical protein NVS55_14625 [Myxococcus stipitatus]|uniref:hypothetical protein n=1 Tax=Myxococcus stipitatus TaxID=83455 RepID=UPI003144EC3B